jgi:hypothetical protein
MPDQKEQSSTPEKSASTSPQKSSNTKLIVIIIVVVAVLAILAGGGYYANRYFNEKSAEKAVEEATGGKVDIDDDGDKITVETDEGKVTMGQNEVPDSFPSDVTVYSGAEVTRTSEVDDSVTLQLTTSDSISTVFDFYKGDLKSNGWKLSTTAESVEDSSLIYAEKNDKQVIVTVSEDTQSDKTLITILVGTNLE